MSGEQVFSRRLLVGWIAAAVIIFVISLYFMGGGQLGDPPNAGPTTFSRSAIGHAGIAELLKRLDIPVVKSQANSPSRLTSAGVLVIAEPTRSVKNEEAIRNLIKANTILFVLPKWRGVPSETKREWVSAVNEGDILQAQWALRLLVPRGEVLRENKQITWQTNTLGPVPNVVEPIQLVRGEQLTPIVGANEGMLIAEIADRNRRIWILSDPDVIANHGLARVGNAALAEAIFAQLRRPSGNIVFDETIHGYVEGNSNPITLLFRFPFVIATMQAAVAIALLLWASLARFGAARSAPPPLNAGRQGLVQNVASLIEFTGHQQVIIRRYVQETIRDVARQLHAPAGLAGEQLMSWLQRVGTARNVSVDCGALVQQASELADTRRDFSQLVRLARDIHRWKREIVDGPSRNPRTR